MGVMVSTVLLVADAEGTAVLAPLDAGGLVVSLRPGLVGVCCCSTFGLCATCYCHGPWPTG